MIRLQQDLGAAECEQSGLGASMATIAVVGKYYAPFHGGIEVNTRDVCEHLAIRHHVTALVHAHSRNEAGTETIDGVDVRRFATLGTIKGQPLSFKLMREIITSRADVFHLHAPNFTGAAALLLRSLLLRRRTPLVITHHTDVHGRRLLRALALPIYRLLVRQASAVIVTSDKNARNSRDLPAGSPTVAIPLGIDPTAFRVTADMIAEAQAWRRSLVGGAPTVGFVGRHARYKGLPTLLQALVALPDLHALIGGDGPYRAQAEALARQLGISDRAHFLGAVEGWPKLRLLSCSDVFAFPSTEKTETFGLVQLEAMAMKLPVVASDLPTGVTDVAVDGETALVVPAGDAAALAQALSRLVEDRALARRLADNAWTALLEKFSKAGTVAATARVIEAAIGRTAPAQRDLVTPSHGGVKPSA